jgi:hypothetical protein
MPLKMLWETSNVVLVRRHFVRATLRPYFCNKSLRPSVFRQDVVQTLQNDFSRIFPPNMILPVCRSSFGKKLLS